MSASDAAAAILVVDDEEGTRESIARVLRPEGYGVREAPSGEAALAFLARNLVDLVLCDVRLDGMDGLECQGRIRTDFPDLPVVIITAYAEVETAVRALKQGAYDYLAKPFSGEELRNVVRRALESRRLRLENDSWRQVARGGEEDVWVGDSPAIRRLYESAERVAASNAAVFVSGETGSGKEILARHLHASSPRRDRVFAALNCAGVPEALADSQIFGHVRGAFTGAVSDARGHLEIADGGTLFLDEIPELRPEVQAKLLRFLDDQRFRRLGSEREVAVDVRILAAAQREPEQLVKEGKLREDLFFRLGGIHLRVPSLRERPGDIAGLALHFLKRFSREIKKPIEGLAPEALAVLEGYAWPGNVRELRNVMERAAIFVAAGGLVGVSELPEKIRRAPGGPTFVVDDIPMVPLAAVTERYIQHVLDHCQGNQAQAGRILGIAPSTLWRHRARPSPKNAEE